MNFNIQHINFTQTCDNCIQATFLDIEKEIDTFSVTPEEKEEVGMHFEWDPKKAASNQRKHGVTFEEASSALRDSFSATG